MEHAHDIMQALYDSTETILDEEELRLRANVNSWDYIGALEALLACKWIARVGERRVTLTDWGRARTLEPHA